MSKTPPEITRSLKDGLLTFVVENWRPVNPYDLSDPPEDLVLIPGDQMSLQIQFKFPEETRNTGVCIVIPVTAK